MVSKTIIPNKHQNISTKTNNSISFWNANIGFGMPYAYMRFGQKLQYIRFGGHLFVLVNAFILFSIQIPENTYLVMLFACEIKDVFVVSYV